jgi:hypothetical protein
MTHTFDKVLQMSPDQRYTYLLKEVQQHQKIWILTDDDGCVMLNSEDEDCVPIWPAEEFAKYWATGEWTDCKPKAIAVGDWLARWTVGLEGDEVNIAVFPNPDEEGLIVFPDVLDSDLRKHS